MPDFAVPGDTTLAVSSCALKSNNGLKLTYPPKQTSRIAQLHTKDRRSTLIIIPELCQWARNMATTPCSVTLVRAPSRSSR